MITGLDNDMELPAPDSATEDAIRAAATEELMARRSAGADFSPLLCSALSPRQDEIIRHALGIRDGKPGYRNHFCTGEGSDDFADCEALVAIGAMERHTREWTPDFIYTVTAAAQSLFLMPNASDHPTASD